MVCHLALEVVTHYFIRAYCRDILSMLGIEKIYLKLGYYFLKILKFNFKFGQYIRSNSLSTLPGFQLLKGGYKGREKEGLGIRGGLVSKVLESRTKS